MGGEGEGSEEDGLSEVEGVFIGDETEFPRKVAMDMRPSKEEVELHNKTQDPPSPSQLVPPLR